MRRLSTPPTPSTTNDGDVKISSSNTAATAAASPDLELRRRGRHYRGESEKSQLRRSNSILSFLHTVLEHKKYTILAALLLIILGIAAATFELELQKMRRTDQPTMMTAPLQTLEIGKNALLKIMSTSALKETAEEEQPPPPPQTVSAAAAAAADDNATTVNADESSIKNQVPNSILIQF